MEIYTANVKVAFEIHEVEAIENCIKVLDNIIDSMKKCNITELYDEEDNNITKGKINVMCEELSTLLNCDEGS